MMSYVFTHEDCMKIIKHSLLCNKLDLPDKYKQLVGFNKDKTRVIIATTLGSICPCSLYILRCEKNIWIREYMEQLDINDTVLSVRMTENDSFNIEIIDDLYMTREIVYRLINDDWTRISGL